MNRYISDLHFSHKNILKFDKRPFLNTETMESKIVDNWNSKVDKSDTTYILGDLCWGKEHDYIRILSQLNGNIVLIRGNHDLKQMSSTLKAKFADIKDYKEITDNGKHVILSHYPIFCYKGSYNPDIWMLHGHTHITKEQDYVEKWTKELVDEYCNVPDNCGHIMNVGCMMPYMNYTPQTLDVIINAWENKYKK